MNKWCVYFVMSFLPENFYSGELPICFLKIRVSSAHDWWPWDDRDEHLVGNNNYWLIGWMDGSISIFYRMAAGSLVPCSVQEERAGQLSTPTPNWERLWRLGQVIDSRRRLSVSKRRSKKTKNTMLYLKCVYSAILNLSFFPFMLKLFSLCWFIHTHFPFR